MEQNKIPKLWIEAINLKAEHEAALHFHPAYSPDQNTACQICYRNGAIEYATMIVDCNRLNTALEEKNISLSEEFADLQARCDRYEKALKVAYHKANEGVFPHEAMAVKKCIEIHTVLNEALSGEGKEVDTRDKIALICHALAEEVAKDAGTAEEYLRKEGVDVDKVKEDAKFIAWLAELAALLHGAAQGQPIKINQEEARKWYDDGCTPYQCFRETWNME